MSGAPVHHGQLLSDFAPGRFFSGRGRGAPSPPTPKTVGPFTITYSPLGWLIGSLYRTSGSVFFSRDLDLWTHGTYSYAYLNICIFGKSEFVPNIGHLMCFTVFLTITYSNLCRLSVIRSPFFAMYIGSEHHNGKVLMKLAQSATPPQSARPPSVSSLTGVSHL